MPHRRYAHRFSLSRIDPSIHPWMLRFLRVPKHIRARLERARTPAATDALLDPRRPAPASRPAKGCAKKGAR